jgi:hypothetical protein
LKDSFLKISHNLLLPVIKQMKIKVCSFFYRHTFILSSSKKQEIWRTVEKLLVDNQVEASSLSLSRSAEYIDFPPLFWILGNLG